MERQKVTEKKWRFLHSRTQRTRCFNKSCNSGNDLTREYLPKLLDHSLSQHFCVGYLFFFLIYLFLLPDLIFVLFLFVSSYIYLFNFSFPFAALAMQADQLNLCLPIQPASAQSRQNSSCQGICLQQSIFLKYTNNVPATTVRHRKSNCA